MPASKARTGGWIRVDVENREAFLRRQLFFAVGLRALPFLLLLAAYVIVTAVNWDLISVSLKLFFSY